MERRALRRLFVKGFKAHGLHYAEGGWQVEHDDVTWSVSLHADGSGVAAPYRLVLGASVRELAPLAPRDAWDCYLFLPLYYSESEGTRSSALTMPDAAFPEWPGTDEERAEVIAGCVDGVMGYISSVDSVDRLRERYTAGDYDNAGIILPMRSLLERPA